MKKLLILLLAAALCLGMFAACTGTPAEIGETADTADNVEPDETTPAEETDAPVKSVTIDGAELKEFHILYSEDDGASVKTAANELAKYIKLATGLDLPVTTDASADGKRIAITTTEEDTENYAYKSDDGGITISGGRTRGALYGVYGFLEDELGLRFLTADTDYVIPSDGIVIENLDYSYEQYFEYRCVYWWEYMKEDMAPKRMLNAIERTHAPIPEELGGDIHYVDNYFVHTINTLGEIENAEGQPCFCDEELYQTVLKNLRAVLEAHPDAKLISVSQMDGTGEQLPFCKCEKCREVLREEKSHMGALLRFINRLAEEIEPDYPDVLISTLAYNDSFRAPKVTVPRDNVIIRICTNIGCKFHPIIDESCTMNKALRSGITAWNEICDRIYIWDYVTDFSYYIMPFPNFNVLADDIRFYYENGVAGVFSQGAYQGDSCEFGELRGYMTAKLLHNPYMTEEEFDNEMNIFMQGYYGAGWENIRAYYDFMMTTLKDHDGSQKVARELLDCDAYRERSDEFTAAFDAAEAAAEDEKTLDHIERTRYSFDFVRLGIAYEDAFAGDDADLQAAVTEEVKDFIKRLNENEVRMSEFQYRICYPAIDAPVTGPFEW